MTTWLFNWRFWNTKLYFTFNKSFWSWTFLQKKILKQSINDSKVPRVCLARYKIFMSSGKILQRQQKGWKIPMSWKFRPILGGCFTNPPKGTPPLKGYTRSYMYPEDMKLPGGWCCCSVLELTLCMCQDFSFWFSFKGHLLLPKSKSVFLPEIFWTSPNHLPQTTPIVFIIYLFRVSFLGEGYYFCFFVRYRFLPRMCQFILGRF